MVRGDISCFKGQISSFWSKLHTVSFVLKHQSPFRRHQEGNVQIQVERVLKNKAGVLTALPYLFEMWSALPRLYRKSKRKPKGFLPNTNHHQCDLAKYCAHWSINRPWQGGVLYCNNLQVCVFVCFVSTPPPFHRNNHPNIKTSQHTKIRKTNQSEQCITEILDSWYSYPPNQYASWTSSYYQCYHFDTINHFKWMASL